MNKGNVIGISYKILNCFLFAVMGILMNKCAKEIPISQVICMRLLLGISIVIACILFLRKSIPLNMSKKRLGLYMLRAAVNYVAFYTWIKSIGEIGLNEATAIIYLHPFWSCLMAKLMCRDKFDMLTGVVILTNVFGVVLVLGPKFDHITWLGISISLLSSFLWAVQDIVCKKQTVSEDSWLQTLYTFLATLVIALPIALCEWMPISLPVFGMLSVLSIVGVINVITFFISFCHASVVTLSPFNSARMLFTLLLAFLFAQSVPTLELLVGSALLVGVNTYYFIRSAKQYDQI